MTCVSPIRLTAKNFKCYGDIELDFSDAQSYCITGSYKDNQNESNGSGKSTFFDMFKFAFYGEYDGKNINNIIRYGQDSTKVSIVFETDKIYKIERIRTKTTSFLYLYIKNESDIWESLTQKTNSETEIEILKILKANYTSFCNSVEFSQRESKLLSEAKTSSDRRKILKEILNIVIYSQLEKIIKESLSDLNKKIFEINTVIFAIGNPEKNLIEIDKILLDKKNDLSNKFQIKSDLENSICKIQNQLSLLNDVANPNGHLKNSLIELKNNKRNLQLAWNNSNKTLEAKNKEFEHVKLNFEEKNNYLKDLKDKFEIIRKKKFRDILIVDNEYNIVNDSIIKLKSEILNIENKLKELNAPMPDGQICPACRQILSKDHRNKCVIEISEQILLISTINTQKQAELQSLLMNIDHLKLEQIEIFNNKIEIDNSISKIENKKEDIKNTKNILHEMKNFIEKIKEDNCDYEKRIGEISIKENEISLLLNNQSKDIEIENCKKELHDLNEKFKKIIQEISKIETEISFYKNEQKNLQLKIDQLLNLQKEQIDLLEQIEYKKYELESYKPSGIPTMIIHSILDDFQAETSIAIKEIKPHIDIRVVLSTDDKDQEDTFDFAYKVHNKKIDYSQLSSGEKFATEWAFKRGLNAAMEKILGYKFGFFLLDEIDQSLDKKTLNLLIDLLLELQNYYKIFIITHNDWVKTKFKNHIQIEFDQINGSAAKIVQT